MKLDVYVDRVAHKVSFTIGPGLAVFNRFLPTRRKINIASPFAHVNEWLFALVAFVPLGYILALIARRLEHDRFLAALALPVGAIGPVYAVAWIGTHLIGREIDTDTMLMGTAIIGMTIAVTLYVLSAREEAGTVRNVS
jgi:glycopeptide antibiotics resistance protein